MKAVNYHIRGIVTSAENLMKGKYLTYFIPGLILAALYWYFFIKTVEIDESIDLTSEIWGISTIAGLLDKGVSYFFGGVEWVMEQIYVFAVITVLSPFFTSLGEEYDEELTGKKTEGGVLRFINDMIRMVFVVILSLLLEVICLGVYWVFSKIFAFPEIVDTIVYFCIASFFFGFAFYDFALERYEKGVFSSLGFAFSAPLGMIIIGALFKGIYAIPYIGIPVAPVLAVMISTVAYAYYIKQLPKSKQLSNE